MAKRVYRKRRCCFHSRWRHSNKSSGSNSKLCKYKIKWNRIKMNSKKRAFATGTTYTNTHTNSHKENEWHREYNTFSLYFSISFACLDICNIFLFLVWEVIEQFYAEHRMWLRIRFASIENYLCVYPYGHCIDRKQNYEWYRIYRFQCHFDK